ncbi:MAG TPA: hypothetical protein VE398_17920 [Acidobacteriota bacterium]|nr:hypothetical protein [Acidobacteriota bacterium]
MSGDCEDQVPDSWRALAGGVAHNLNNILGVIVSHADLAQCEAGDNPFVNESMAEILKAVDRAKEQVKRLAALDKPGTLPEFPARAWKTAKD